jgi:hypothetical protein
MRINLSGKMSTFGGPGDKTLSRSEGLALVDEKNLKELQEYFLPQQPPRTTGLARRLNPEKFYLACRWDYGVTPKDFLRKSLVQVKNPENGKTAQAKPVDWGPNERTGRVADLSPGLARFLGLEANDVVEVTLA